MMSDMLYKPNKWESKVDFNPPEVYDYKVIRGNEVPVHVANGWQIVFVDRSEGEGPEAKVQVRRLKSYRETNPCFSATSTMNGELNDLGYAKEGARWAVNG